MDVLIRNILETVPTYKDDESLIKISEEAGKLKQFSRVLILGPGQGAEAILIKKRCPTCYMIAIDKWNEWVDNGLMNTFALNQLNGFIENCNKFNVTVDKVITADVFKSRVLTNLGKNWDFIYYDCRDNKQGGEFEVITNMLKYLWSMLNRGGILMGDDYRFTLPDFAMAPIVDSFFNDTKDAVDFDCNTKGETLYWMVRKNG